MHICYPFIYHEYRPVVFKENEFCIYDSSKHVVSEVLIIFSEKNGVRYGSGCFTPHYTHETYTFGLF